MGEGKASPKLWAIVLIAIAIIGCIGTILAATIEILGTVLLPTPAPLYTLVPQVNTPVDDPGESATSVALASTAPPTFTPLPSQGQESAQGSTPYPTYTPLPTYTPYPTPATVVATPQPTATDPPPEALEVGQTWEYEGAALTLSGADLNGDQITLYLVFTNNTPQTLNFTFTVPDDVTVKDNLGRKYTLSQVWALIVDRRPDYSATWELSLESGEREEFGILKWKGPFTDKSVEYLLVTVNISRIQEARWRIPIYH